MRTLFLSLSLALPLVCVGASASAQEAPDAGQRGADAATPGGAEPRAAPFETAAVDDRELGTIAGRENTRQVALNEQSAGVSRNSVGDNSVTGDAQIDGNAFQNMSGFSILNVNTGNNVAINAAMTVNISIQPGS
ncbi:MAG TPA: hypothetical protein VFS49_01105 [Croceibacterium sp.]|nr:hypothetical protein [Croceibacterium sp.]